MPCTFVHQPLYPGRTQRGPAIGILLFAVFSCAALLSANPANAQDSHYWNIAYGTRATLLGGTVIGSVSDLSATYYNPGMLAVSREPGLLLGANVYSYQKISLEGGKEGGTTTSRIAPAPGLVAGRLPIDTAMLGGLAYSILTRSYFSTNLSYRFVGTREIIGGNSGPEQVATEVGFGTELSETWIGLTAFRRLIPSLGLGVTNFVAVRNHELRSSVLGNALISNGPLTMASTVSNVEYTNIRLLWKFGIALDVGDVTAGMTVTTPSINLFGSGSSFYMAAYNGFTNASDSLRTELLHARNEEDLPTDCHTSWAIGVGVGYRVGNSRLHLSAEWFAPVGPYEVMETLPFVGQSDGTTISKKIQYEMRSVVNVGVGFDYRISATASLYASVRTDLTGLTSESSNSLAVTAWNLYHMTGGGVLRFEPFDLTLGLSYASGSNSVANIPWTRASSDAGGTYLWSRDSEVRYLTLTGVLAFSFRF